MTLAQGYHYTKRDLIQDPEHYFYSQYEGDSFFHHWRSARAHVLSALQEGNGECPSVVRSEAVSVIEDFQKGNMVDTRSLLNELFAALADCREEVSSHVRDAVNVMVKKFEVTKRVYTTYGNGAAELSERRYDDLGLYVSMAEVCHCAYEKTGMIVYLNALLKCIDTLSSVAQRLNHEQQVRLRKLILSEEKHISSLCV